MIASCVASGVACSPIHIVLTVLLVVVSVIFVRSAAVSVLRFAVVVIVCSCLGESFRGLFIQLSVAVGCCCWYPC